MTPVWQCQQNILNLTKAEFTALLICLLWLTQSTVKLLFCAMLVWRHIWLRQYGQLREDLEQNMSNALVFFMISLYSMHAACVVNDVEWLRSWLKQCVGLQMEGL